MSESMQRGGEVVKDVPTLEMPSAGDIDKLVRAHGSLFVVTDRSGDIAPPGARELGLFSNDTRYLSSYLLEIPAVQIVRLSAEVSRDAHNQIDLMVTGLESSEFLDDPQNFLHICRQQVLRNDFAERITFTNFLHRSVDLNLSFSFGADYADIFEVRGAKRAQRGAFQKPAVSADSVILEYRGLDGATYGTRIRFAPTPTSLTASRALFRVSLAPGETDHIEVVVTPSHQPRKPLRVTPLPARRQPFSKRMHALEAEAEEFREESTRWRCDNAMMQQVLDQATADLRMLRVKVKDHTILGAGIPWFCAPFGRDSLLAAYEALTFNPSLAAASLRFLAAYQGKKSDERTEEEPGKIFHELRFGEMARTGETPHNPYYGSIDATPLFVVVAEAYYRMTGDKALLTELRPALEAAIAWLDVHTERATHLLTYERRTAKGLDNQGWKDSKAGVSYPDGRVAKAPIALVEVQGYAADAYLRAGHIFEAFGDQEQADNYTEHARRMRELIEDRFWLESLGRYAFAVEKGGGVLDTRVSNSGHLLWSRVPNPERARKTADLLLSRDSFSGFGIRTLARGQPVYNPLSYHNGTVWPHDNAIIAMGMANYRLPQHTRKVFEGLMAAASYFTDHRLPELFCGMGRSAGNLVRYPVACSPQAWAAAAPFLLLQSVLGISADAPRGRLIVRNPVLPPHMRVVTVERMRVGNSRVTATFRRVGRSCHIERLEVRGAPLRTDIEID